MKEMIIGTRGSELALYQARLVASELRNSGYEGEIVEKIIQTSGDKHKDIKLSENRNTSSPRELNEKAVPK